MAVRLEFLSLIVRIDKIEEKYPGGWIQCKKDNQKWIGGAVWYDSHLFRDGVMNPGDMKFLVDHWISLGFEGKILKGNEEVWGEDLCVADYFSGPTLPCSWIMKDAGKNYVYLSATNPEPIIGREEMKDRLNPAH